MTFEKIERIKFSVIVTAYNQADTIEQTIMHILKQKCHFPFEIIIGDDCSNDGTKDICIEYEKKYPGIIKNIIHETNKGVGVNFVLCVKKAMGEYIAICAADDFWHNPLKLQLQSDFLDSHPDYGLVYTEHDRLNSRTNILTNNWIKSSGTTVYQGNGLFKAFAQGRVPALAHTVVFRKSLFDKFVPADDYIKLQFPIEDWPTWLILSKYTKIGYLPISTATYRYGSESLSNPLSYNKIVAKYAKEEIMYKYLCDLFPEDLHLYENEWDIKVNRILLNLA